MRSAHGTVVPPCIECSDGRSSQYVAVRAEHTAVWERSWFRKEVRPLRRADTLLTAMRADAAVADSA